MPVWAPGAPWGFSGGSWASLGCLGCLHLPGAFLGLSWGSPGTSLGLSWVVVAVVVVVVVVVVLVLLVIVIVIVVVVVAVVELYPLEFLQGLLVVGLVVGFLGFGSGWWLVLWFLVGLVIGSVC